MKGDLEPVSETLDDLFARLGVPNAKLQSDLIREWEDLAGKPWSGRSRPLVVRGKTLVVEATSTSMIAFLRYGESALLVALGKRFGEGVVTGVEIVAPGRS